MGNSPQSSAARVTSSNQQPDMFDMSEATRDAYRLEPHSINSVLFWSPPRNSSLLLTQLGNSRVR